MREAKVEAAAIAEADFSLLLWVVGDFANCLLLQGFGDQGVSALGVDPDPVCIDLHGFPGMAVFSFRIAAI